MLVGILGAIAQDDVKRILSFNIVSHIGYMVMGLALFTVAGLAGDDLLRHPPHRGQDHAVPDRRADRARRRVEPPQPAGRHGAHRARSLAVLFLVPALSLAGIPPLSGFVPKFALVDAGSAVDEPVIVAVSLLVSLLTLFSLMKIWAGVFWNPATAEPRARPIPPAASAARC